MSTTDKARAEAERINDLADTRAVPVEGANFRVDEESFIAGAEWRDEAYGKGEEK